MKKIAKWFAYIILSLAALVALLIGPIDRSPLKGSRHYQKMMGRLDTLTIEHSNKSKSTVGWSKFNITPSYSMPMAGYTPKDRFETIHDSVYCRILAIENAGSSNFIVSLDLMLFPPIIMDRVNAELKKRSKNYFVFYSATHTHSSLGGWDKSLVGRLALGSFHEEWVNKTVQDILTHIEVARSNSKASSIYYWQAEANEFVQNRLASEHGKVDGKLRGLKFVRNDSSKAIITTYSGHPTNVELLSRIISADYPATLTNHLEKNGFDFGVFLAGMIGSHRLVGFEGSDFERIENAGQTLAEKVLSAKVERLPDSISISSAHIPIDFGPSQLRIGKNLKVREWAFNGLIGSLKGELTYLAIGNVVLLGTPCDFSGEIFAQEKLDSLANAAGKKLIITSFNGNYTGYVTADQYYEKGNQEEVMALNWVGPYFGEYYSDVIKKIIQLNSRPAWKPQL